MIQAEQPVSCWKYLSDGQKRPDSAIDQLVKAVPFLIRPRLTRQAVHFSARGGIASRLAGSPKHLLRASATRQFNRTLQSLQSTPCSLPCERISSHSFLTCAMLQVSQKSHVLLCTLK